MSIQAEKIAFVDGRIRESGDYEIACSVTLFSNNADAATSSKPESYQINFKITSTWGFTDGYFIELELKRKPVVL